MFLLISTSLYRLQMYLNASSNQRPDLRFKKRPDLRFKKNGKIFSHVHLIMSQRSLIRSQSEIVRTEQTDFAGQYDYVFVFKMVNNDNNSGVFEQSDCAKKCIFSMLEAGLEVFPYLSIQQDELLVLVKCSVRSSIYHLI